MPALIQICVVIVTTAIVAIVIMTARLMTRFNKFTMELSQLSNAVRESVVKFDPLTREAQALLTSLRGVDAPATHAVEPVGPASERAARLSSSILHPWELPVLAAAAVATGLRSGARHLLKRVVNQFTHNDPKINRGISMNDSSNSRGIEA